MSVDCIAFVKRSYTGPKEFLRRDGFFGLMIKPSHSLFKNFSKINL